jgi:hypothetical protein
VVEDGLIDLVAGAFRGGRVGRDRLLDAEDRGADLGVSLAGNVLMCSRSNCVVPSSRNHKSSFHSTSGSATYSTIQYRPSG